MPSDSELIAQTAQSAANARSAAEGVAATVGALSGIVRDVAEEVASIRATSPIFVLDRDDPNGAVYITDGIHKRWIRSQERLVNLTRRIPGGATVEEWDGADIADIELVGPPPTAPDPER